MSNTTQITIRRECAGRCGTTITYTLEAGEGPFAPDMYCELVAYRGGHVCRACEFVIEAALAERRTAIAAAAFVPDSDG